MPLNTLHLATPTKVGVVCFFRPCLSLFIHVSRRPALGLSWSCVDNLSQQEQLERILGTYHHFLEIKHTANMLISDSSSSSTRPSISRASPPWNGSLKSDMRKKQKHGSSYFHHIFRMKTARMIGFYMLRPPFWTTVILDPHKSHTWNLGYLPTRDHELSGALWKKHCCGSLPHNVAKPRSSSNRRFMSLSSRSSQMGMIWNHTPGCCLLFFGETPWKTLCSGRLARNMWHHMVNPILKY